jgi:hypothetical protein
MGVKLVLSMEAIYNEGNSQRRVHWNICNQVEEQEVVESVVMRSPKICSVEASRLNRPEQNAQQL